MAVKSGSIWYQLIRCTYFLFFKSVPCRKKKVQVGEDHMIKI